MDRSTNLDLDETVGSPDDEAPLEYLIGWARGRPGPAVREDALPGSAKTTLADARAEHPGRTLTCLAFRTLLDGVETTRLGVVEADIPSDQLLALSVVTSSAALDGISVVAHTLVVRNSAG